MNRGLLSSKPLVLLLIAAAVVGCGRATGDRAKPTSGSDDAIRDVTGTEATPIDDGDAEELTSDKPFQLADMVEPFDPPPLEELENSHKWTDSPVVDAMVRLRDAKAQEPPLVSIEQALKMRNDSPEANRKIYSALSAVAPPDGAGVNWNATMNRALIMDLRSTNGVLSSSISENEITKLTSFNLFGFDWEMSPFAVSDHVVSWQTSTDHTIDKVVMRNDLVWSDGKPITAHDVAFSFKLIMSSAVPIPAQRTGTDEIRWVEAYDDHTLAYFHKRPLATNVWNLNFQVVPKHVYEKSAAEDPTLRSSEYHRNVEKKPVTGGPYEVAHWARGQEILLKRRESYYLQDGKPVRDKPYFAEMRFRIIEDGNTRLLALKSGDIDESELEAEQWQTQTAGDDYYRENTKVSGPEWLYMYIGWNLDTKKVPFFADVRVRRAMAHAMNYDEMLNDLCYGLFTQCFGIFHPDAWMFPKNPAEPYRHDLDKAEDLLDEAGWVDSDSDGVRDKEVNGQLVPFRFTLMVSNKPDRIAICNLFRENLENIGVICDIRPLEAAVFQERAFSKNFEASCAGWSTGADPFTNKNIYGTGEARNYFSYSNPQVDALFEQAMQEFDRSKQAEIYGKIHNLVYEDQPCMFLYNKHSLYGFNKKLRGYRFSPRGPFHYSPGIDSIWSL
jgi:peptide/nickel transport system substrate-binding protein